MAEAGIVAYGITVVMAIALTVTCFVLRGKGHPSETNYGPP